MTSALQGKNLLMPKLVIAHCQRRFTPITSTYKAFMPETKEN